MKTIIHGHEIEYSTQEELSEKISEIHRKRAPKHLFQKLRMLQAMKSPTTEVEADPILPVEVKVEDVVKVVVDESNTEPLTNPELITPVDQVVSETTETVTTEEITEVVKDEVTEVKDEVAETVVTETEEKTEENKVDELANMQLKGEDSPTETTTPVVETKTEVAAQKPAPKTAKKK